MKPAQLLAHFDRISDAPDAIPRLRRFILDLAVRGKLVEQDPKNEPATELLKRIKAEKARLVKTGDIRKKEPLPPVRTEDVLSESPANWTWARLDETSILITKGSTPTSYGHAFVPSGVNFIKVESIKDGRLLAENVTSFISEETHGFLARSRLASGDILFSIAGSIGTCALVTDSILPANTNQALAIIRGTSIVFDAKFILTCIKSSIAHVVFSKARGGAMNNVSLEDVRSFVIPVPPFAEQHRIVAKVDELMSLCDRLEAAQAERESLRDRLAAASVQRLNQPAGTDAPDAFREHARFYLNQLPRLTTRPEQIKQLRQTILNVAVRGRLVPQDANDEPASHLLKRIRAERSDDEPFPVPVSWVWVAVVQIGESRLGKMLDKAKNKGIPRRYLRNINVRWFDFDLGNVLEMRFEDAELDEFRLRRGDVLICEGGEPGRAAVWDEREKGIYFQKAIHRVRFPRFPQGVVPAFFVNAIRQSADSGRLSAYFTGVGIKHFTGKGLDSFLFPLPPLAEQHRIVAKVDELMALCDQLEAQLTTAQTESRRLLEAVLHEALGRGHLPER